MSRNAYEPPEFQFEQIDPVTGEPVPMYIDPARPSWSGSFYTMRKGRPEGTSFVYGDAYYDQDFEHR